LNISLFWHENGYIRCFGVKNRRKWKISAESSLYECTDLQLKLQWLMCIVAANFIKISERIPDISPLTIFLNGSVHHLESLNKFNFWTTVMLWIANMCHHAKFNLNWLNICKDIVNVWIFHYFGTKTVIFAVLGVKNRRKWKMSAESLLYECTDLQLKLQWLMCIVAANFIKISERIPDISPLTIFFKRQRPPSWIL